MNLIGTLVLVQIHVVARYDTGVLIASRSNSSQSSWFSVMRSKIKNRTSSCNKVRLDLSNYEAINDDSKISVIDVLHVLTSSRVPFLSIAKATI